MRLRTGNNRRRYKLGQSPAQKEARRWERLEDRIYNEQCRIIDNEYGEDTDANLGWGVMGTKFEIDVATKVYVEGHPILRSVGNVKTGRIEHGWC